MPHEIDYDKQLAELYAERRRIDLAIVMAEAGRDHLLRLRVIGRERDYVAVQRLPPAHPTPAPFPGERLREPREIREPLRDLRRRAGLCTRCGDAEIYRGGLCEPHYEKQREYNRKSDAKRSSVDRSLREAV